MRKTNYQIHEENKEKINEIISEASKYYRVSSFIRTAESIIDIAIENLKNEPKQES